MKELYLAGGPYYGIQEVFSRIKGVTATEAGYANSAIADPIKEDVDSGRSGAAECVKVTYNPKKIDIGTLLSIFFTIVNPYTEGEQGQCKGTQYRSGIYYTSGEDTIQITYYMAFINARGRARPMTESCLVMNDAAEQTSVRPPICTEVKKLENFYPAPPEEQYYLRTHPEAYSPVDIALLEKVGVLEKVGK